MSTPDSKRLLIIEDDEAFASALLDSALQHPRVSYVEHVPDLAGAKHAIEHQHFDVAAVDLGLPDGTGTEFIASAPEPLACVVLTIHEEPEAITQALEAGAAGFLLKHDIALLDRLLDAGTGHFPISARMAAHLISRWPGTGSQRHSEASPLSVRELEILQTLARGLTYRETGVELNISEHTVADHIKNIYRKLSVSSRSAAIYQASRQGWLRLPTN